MGLGFRASSPTLGCWQSTTDLKLALLALDIQVQVSRSNFLSMISFLLGRGNFWDTPTQFSLRKSFCELWLGCDQLQERVKAWEPHSLTWWAHMVLS